MAQAEGMMETPLPNSQIISKASVGGKEYTVITKNVGGKNTEVVTTVYLGDAEVSTTRNFCGRAMMRDIERKCAEFMVGQHNRAVNALRARKPEEAKSPGRYLREAKGLLGRKSGAKALALLTEGMAEYPDDPFLMSYWGALAAGLEGRHEDGIKAAREAIAMLRKNIPYGLEFFYPSLYLNLGRAYLAAGMKREAIEAFKEGVEKGGGDEELVRELRALGVRRRPPVPFLARTNPINKYIGIALHRLKK
jgi:tetratricopeptide (TPR) repeat protein